MKNTIYITIFCLFTVTFLVEAQEIKPISKAEVLAKVAEKNTTIQISEEEFNASKADYRQTNAVFLPNITASHTGISTTNPLMSFGSKLNQEILTAADFNPDLLNDPTTTRNFATKIEIQQPLINLDGFYKRKAAKTKMEAMSLKTERTQDYLAFEVDKAYMQLQLAYKAVEVLEKALDAANANKQMADNSFKQGFLQRADVLNVEIRVTEVKNQLQMAKSNVQNASNYLSFLMNDESDILYKPTESLVVASFNVDNKTISENRADIKAMHLASKAYEAMNKADKMAFLPRLNAFGSYEMYDNKIFQGDANGYLIGAQLSWDIFQGSKRFGKAQKSKAELEKSKLEYNQYVSKSNLELNKVKRQLVDAKNSLELTDLAVQQSEESLRIRKNRFKEGLEKTSDLLMAETQFAQKQLEYYQTIYQYNFTQTYLNFLTKK
ncbi:TolC family protein [Polaribacter undariae]|uniref:TolC family protein n=1 Tax=Polaribacter sejongensis TaxID=985043 RepID=A0AAJ1R039_9FLAO|nr:TolC family protein [Polaribacter undariae]MDN3620945.1 TolC family protein [Polaribacter undariae]UWD31078.1 TolC family protein [Polaribacter undariae]